MGGEEPPGLLCGHALMTGPMPFYISRQSCVSWCQEGLWGFLSVRCLAESKIESRCSRGKPASKPGTPTRQPSLLLLHFQASLKTPNTLDNSPANTPPSNTRGLPLEE